MKLTIEMIDGLKAKGFKACSEHRDKLARLYPDGVELNLWGVIDVCRNGIHVFWLAGKLDGFSSDILRGADLRYADLRYADLRYADLRGANLRYADLRYADLRYADLRGANLIGTDLRYADLRGANLRGADLSDAKLPATSTNKWIEAERERRLR